MSEPGLISSRPYIYDKTPDFPATPLALSTRCQAKIKYFSYPAISGIIPVIADNFSICIFQIYLQLYLIDSYSMNRTTPSILTVILGAILCFSNQAYSEDEALTFQQYLDKANENIKTYRNLEAAEALKKATELGGGKHPALHMRLAILYYGLGLIGEAIHEGETAAALAPSSKWYKYDLAKFYYVDKQYAKAEQQFSALLKLDPGFTLGYYYLGELFYKNARYDLAWPALMRAQLLGYRGRYLEDRLRAASDLPAENPIAAQSAAPLFRFIKTDSADQARELLAEIDKGKLFENLELETREQARPVDFGVMLLDELKDSVAATLSDSAPYSPPAIVNIGDHYLIMQRILPFALEQWETTPASAASQPNAAPAPRQGPAAENTTPEGETTEEPMLFSTKIASLYAIESWKESWENKNVAEYLKIYSTKFIPPDDLSLEEWQARRREALTKPEFIKITISDQVIETLSATQLLATFKQTYRSNSYNDEVVKTLSMEKEDSGWKIVDERVVRIIKQ